MFDFFKKKKPAGKDTNKPSRDEIIAQAKANAAKARAEIGEENIQRMAEALKRMEDPSRHSPGKRAQEEIKKIDKGRVADELKHLLEDK